MSKNISEDIKNILPLDILQTINRYKYLGETGFEYYRRQENIGSFIYDHLFLKLFHKLPLDEKNPVFIGFRKAINQCHINYLTKININKPKNSLSHRTYNVTNFYNIIYYEIQITKLLNIFYEIFTKHENISKTLKNKLIDNAFFGYAHQINIINKEEHIRYYLNGWINFENKKQELLKEYEFFTQFDITNYYNNIDHNIFIDLLGTFLNKYSDIPKINEFLYTLQDSLFKANRYKNIGIPQGLLGSDILSTIFLWLLLLENSDLLGLHYQDNVWIHKNDIKLIFYADDFFIAGKNKNHIHKFNHHIKNFFYENNLSIHGDNSGVSIQESEKYPQNDINFSLIQTNDRLEIDKLFNKINKELEKNLIDINISLLKKLFRWIYKIGILDEGRQKEILANFRNICITPNDLESAKKFFILQSISVKAFSFLLEQLLTKKICSSEKIFIRIYNVFGYLLAPGTIEIFLLYNENNQNFSKNFFQSIQNIYKGKFFTNLNSEKLLEKELRKQKLSELEKLIYHKEISTFEENSLGLKMNYLFKNHQSLGLKLPTYIHNLYKQTNKELQNHLLKLSHTLIEITDNMILIKSTKPHTYLNDQGFIADLYSLFNLLLGILISIVYLQPISAKILGTTENNIGKIELKGKNKNTDKTIDWEKFPLILVDKNLQKIGFILFYITKLRAALNHKEKDTQWNDFVNIFHKFQDKEHFYYSIQDAIDIIFKKIEEYIEN